MKNSTRHFLGISLLLTGFLGASPTIQAGNFVIDSSSTDDVPINSAANWIVIAKAPFVISALDNQSHACVATASADMQGPRDDSPKENQYRFVLSMDTTNPADNGGSERMVETNQNEGVNDPDSIAVLTTHRFVGATGTNGPSGNGSHTIYFLGKKVLEEHVSRSVLDATLAVICVHQ